MTTKSAPVIENSVKVYRLLLSLYPKEHRTEYGWLMVQLFRDKAYDAYREDGNMGVVLHCISALVDLLTWLFNERHDQGITSTFAFASRLRSPMMIAGGLLVTLSSVYQLKPGFWWQNNFGLYKLSEMLLLPGSILFAIGLFWTVFKLRRIFKSTHQTRTLLPFAGIVFLSLSGIVSTMMLVSAMTSDWNEYDDLAWYVLTIMSSGVFSALLLTVVTLFRCGQRWSLILALHPIWFFLAWIQTFFVEYEDIPGPDWGMFLGVVILGIFWMFAGYKLRDVQVVYTNYPTLNEQRLSPAFDHSIQENVT